jgi:hypothetical protein
MPKIATTCKSYDPSHPARLQNACYSANHYAKYGQTPEYKERKKREYQRRKEYRKSLKDITNQSRNFIPSSPTGQIKSDQTETTTRALRNFVVEADHDDNKEN